MDELLRCPTEKCGNQGRSQFPNFLTGLQHKYNRVGVGIDIDFWAGPVGNCPDKMKQYFEVLTGRCRSIPSFCVQVLSVQNARQWHDIGILDESWIHLFSEHDLM
jgi:hypothetical protein